MAVRKTKTTDDKPKRKLNRVMIDAKKDDFYVHPYTVVDRICLNFFKPKDNSNKFYIAQIHASDVGKGFRFYVNHGRVGANGFAKAEPFNTLDDARKKYQTKVREKLRKGYVQVYLATVARGSEQGQKKINVDALKGVVDTSKINTQVSKLPQKVAEFVKHIYEEANQAVSLSLTGSVKSDIRAPLGNLGINGINMGRQILSNIVTALKYRDMDRVRMLSVGYYRYIPRKLPGDVRDESKWLLNSKERIEKEMEILDLYEDTLRILPIMGVSDIDAKYAALNCDIRYVTEPEILSYVENKIATTHAPNHNFKLRVVNVFEVNLKNAPRFDDSCGNVRRLFHGSRSANMVGILSSYLKLPYHLGSGVIKTGAMFGPGIYFAHDCTKSANYSFGTWAGRPNKHKTAFLFICDVALGNVYKVDAPHNFHQPPQGYHSVMGCKGRFLLNHEFIVYRPEQVRIRYVV